MKLKKRMRALSVLLALLFVSVVMVSAVSAEEMQASDPVEQNAGYEMEKYTVRLVDSKITPDQISATTQTLMSSFEKEFSNLPPRFIGTSELNLSEDEKVVAYVFQVLPSGESISYAEVVSADENPSLEEVSSRVDAWMDEPLESKTAGSLKELTDVSRSNGPDPIHSATISRTYSGIGQAFLVTTWFWDDQETNSGQDYFYTKTTLTTDPGISISGYEPYRNYLFNVEINPDYSLGSYQHLPSVSGLDRYPQTTTGFTTIGFCLSTGGCALDWSTDIPDTRVERHHPYGNVYSWDEEFNIGSDCATTGFDFTPAMSTYCSQSARDGSTYIVSKVKADVSDGWFKFHDGLPYLGPSGTNYWGHFCKTRWSGDYIHV